MSRYRSLAGAALLAASLVLAACATGDQPSASTGDDATVSSSPGPSLQPARFGVPFRTGSFEVTVTRVETGVRELDISDAAKSRGLQPWTPTNGQYVVVYLTVKNLGNVETGCATSDSGIIDDAGRTYGSVVLMGGAPPVGQGLGGDNLQPGASANGFVVFDVPASVGRPAMLLLRTKVYGTTNTPPAMVNLRS
jgi:hypothetical protein